MRKNTAPTKTNLMALKNELKFASLGHELLDQKRNILVMELLNLVDQAVDFQEKADKTLNKAYSSLEDAALDMGKRRLLTLSSAIRVESEVKLSQRKVMGVSLPVVQTEYSGEAPWYSPTGNSYHVDMAIDDFRKALEMTGKLAELKISIMRLAREVKKTIRKVNALEKIAIPDLEETVAHIQNRLEENERDMLILMKRVKSRLESKRMNP
jgi:V/A-type H+/Na+-transporting ATPase subunit D